MGFNSGFKGLRAQTHNIFYSILFHIKHINTLCGQKVELLNVKLVVHILATGLRWVSIKVTGWGTLLFKSTLCTSIISSEKIIILFCPDTVDNLQFYYS